MAYPRGGQVASLTGGSGSHTKAGVSDCSFSSSLSPVPFFPAPGTVVVVCVAGFALLELLAGLLLLLFFFFLPPFFFLDVEDVDDAGTAMRPDRPNKVRGPL